MFWGILVCFELRCVELAGVEPASKQETEMLSTCLSGYWFSMQSRQSAAYFTLICFILLAGHNFLQTIPYSPRLRFSKRRESSEGDVLTQAPWRGLKLIYCDSIKLQERNLIRLLIVCNPDLRALSPDTACLHTPFALLSKPNNPK